MRFRFIVFLGIILTVFSSNSYTWYAVCVDTLSYSGTDIEVDSLGYPHIIYHQSGKGLTYARWDGAQWLYECVEESLVIKGRAYIGKTYLELDTQGYPHISMPGPTYIWKDIIGWHKEDLPIPYNHNNHYTCLKLDSTDHPHIVYNLLEYWFWQSGPMSQTIWETDVVHHCYDGSNWHKKVVASDWEEKWCWDWMHCEHSGGQVGNLGASIALHNDDTFHIAYSSDQYYESMDKIIYKCMDTSWTPFSEFVDSANSPRISIEVDSQNRPFIVYQDFVSGLWISKRENGIWNTEPVGEEGKGFAFLLDSLDKPFITYGNDSQVRIARNRFGGWNKETIDSTTDNALSVMSLGIAIDRYGYIHISYPRSENSVWYATTSPIFASVSWSVSPESIQINTQTGVIVAVKDSSGNSYPGVEIHIRGYGVDLYDTTDISGEAILNVDAPYGEQLQVVGRDTNNQKELFTEFLPVYGGSELFSPDIGAYSDTIGVSDGMMIDIPGTVWGYAQETGYTLYLKGCGIDTSHYTSGDSIKIELIPTEVGDMMCAIGKSGYNIYQDAVRVKIYKGWLSGYVLDSSTSDSLINVHIKGYEVGVDTSVSDPVFNITTNIYGFYEVGDSIPCGDYDVYSNVFGYQPSLEVVTIKHGDNMHNVEMLIGSSGIISGTIKERGSGDPLTSEINIYRTDSSFYKIYKIKKSDSLSGGVYSVRLPLSTFRFVVSSYGHIPMYTPVSLDTDSLELNFVMDTILGTILIIDDSGTKGIISSREAEFTKGGLPEKKGSPSSSRAGSAATKFYNWLTGVGYYVDTTTTALTDTSDWALYDFLVVSSGSYLAPLNSNDITNKLIDWIDNDGKLLIEGGEVGYDWRETTFGSTVLHITGWHSDNAGNLPKQDTTHPLTTILNILPDSLFITYSGYGDEDAVILNDNANLIYGTRDYLSDAGILVYDPTPPIESGQIVYYAFNLDALQDTVAARHLVENTAFYFYTSEPPGPDTLYGNVNLFDTSDNGGVVVTARLSGYVCTDTTGESGDYMIPNLFDGLYEITASKEGYMDSILSDFNITGNHQMGFTLCPLVVLYEEDFESDNGGYTGTGDWQCGIPNSGPQVAHSGERLWATNLSGDYSNSSNSMLTTVEIDLSSVMGFPILSFYQWYHIEGYYDGGNVKISVNEGSWEILDSLSPPYNVDVAYWENTGIPGEPCYSGSQEAWKEIKKDLSAYRGNTIRIRFHFGSDGLRKYTGWYIDDITVYYGKRVSEEIPSVYSMTIDGVTIGDEFNIRYALPEKGEVVLTVYDIAGRVVRRICEIKEAGWYQTNINMQGMSSSVYFIKIKAGSFTKTKKSVFLH